jgi:hypothetical protein
MPFTLAVPTAGERRKRTAGEDDQTRGDDVFRDRY